ncbi:MAG: hypothetical protein JSS02_10495 [Planctomycetes bacterium]|nr:hypothetical protein [Planctomycetota bacterium]
MFQSVSKWISTALVVGAFLAGGQVLRADGYYYQPRSLYVMPPVYAYQPVFAPPPIVYYEPVAVRPAPVAGYVVPVAAPVVPVVAARPVAVPVSVPARVTERQVVTPHQSRYRYHVHSPYAPDYTYRVRDNGTTVRFNERWTR